MYFACTPADPDTFSNTLCSAFASLQAEDRALRLYAIVDAGFDGRLARRVRKTAVSVAEHSSLADIKEHLPFVLPLEESPGAAALSSLLADAGNRPMLSFIATAAGAPALAIALQRLLIARSEDDTRWPLRFADTRILPVLLGELAGAPGGADLPAGLVAWWWPRRDGRLASFFNKAPARPVSPAKVATELALDDKQFARMLSAGRADGVIAQLCEACPEILDRSLPHQNHEKISAALELLAARSFDSAELELRWAGLALCLPQDLARVPALSAALAKANSASELLAALDQLGDELWAVQEERT